VPLLAVEGLTRRFGGLVAVNKVGFSIAPAQVVSVVGPNGAGKTTLFNLIAGVTRPDTGHVTFDGRDMTGFAPHRLGRMGMARTFQNLAVSYGAVPAVSDVSLEIAPGELRVILGANGAGKTTIIKTILGLQRARAGTIRLDDRHDLLAMKPHRIHHLGIAWVPEGRQLWQTMTVMDNLRMGGFEAKDQAAVRRRIAGMLERFPRLAERQGQLAGSLSGGEQQMVAIARALVSGPRLLLMDEPSLGLAPLVVRDIFALVRKINAEGVAILMVEQNARQALKVAHWAYLLELGHIVEFGRAEEIAGKESVKAVFLGGAA